MAIAKRIAVTVGGAVLGYFAVGIPAYIVFGTDSLIPPVLMLGGIVAGAVIAWRRPTKLSHH